MNGPGAGAGGRRGRHLLLTRSFLSTRYHTGKNIQRIIVVLHGSYVFQSGRAGDLVERRGQGTV